MRTNDNCCYYNNGHKHRLHFLLFEFVLQKCKNTFILEDCSVVGSHLSSAFFIFLALPKRICIINTKLLIKDNVHNVFMFTKHLRCIVANLHILILFYR